MSRSLLAALALWTLGAVARPAAAAGQASAAADSSQRPDCFRGRPAPRCRAFWVTEVGYYRWAVGTGFVQRYESAAFEREHLDSHLSWEIGRMVNRGRDAALGGTLLVGGDNGGTRVAVKARYRRWLGGGGALDVAAGPLRAPARVPFPTFGLAAYGLTGDVALGWRDLGAVSVRADAVWARDRPAAAVYGGVRLGSYPAVAATAVGAVAAAVLLVAIARTSY